MMRVDLSERAVREKHYDLTLDELVSPTLIDEVDTIVINVRYVRDGRPVTRSIRIHTSELHFF